MIEVNTSHSSNVLQSGFSMIIYENTYFFIIFLNTIACCFVGVQISMVKYFLDISSATLIPLLRSIKLQKFTSFTYTLYPLSSHLLAFIFPILPNPTIKILYSQ